MKAAVRVNKRPSAVLLNDDFAGHRRGLEPWEDPEPEFINVWTDWDFALLRAVQYVEDYTDANGQLIFLDQDPDVYWDVSKITSYSEKARSEYSDIHGDPKAWETLIVTPSVPDDVEKPSLEKWARRMSELPQAEKRPEGTGFGPSKADLAAMEAAKNVQDSTEPTET